MVYNDNILMTASFEDLIMLKKFMKIMITNAKE